MSHLQLVRYHCYYMELGRFIAEAGQNGRIGFNGLRVNTDYGQVQLYSGDINGVFVAFAENTYTAVFDKKTGTFIGGNTPEVIVIEVAHWSE